MYRYNSSPTHAFFYNNRVVIKKILKYIILPLSIILSFIYFKNNKIELFTSFIDNYIERQNIYNDQQNKLNLQEIKINNIGDTIENVLNGVTIPNHTRNPNNTSNPSATSSGTINPTTTQIN